jgi:hypothetical protein
LWLKQKASALGMTMLKRTVSVIGAAMTNLLGDDPTSEFDAKVLV